MVSYIKGGMQAKGIWKQDPEANIYAQKGSEWGLHTLYRSCDTVGVIISKKKE